MISELRYTFPSLRCRMGDWWYYITFMKFSDVSHWIKQTDEIYTAKMLREMVQRALQPRAKEIVEYLTTEKEHFFNSVIVGVYGGEPQWYPISVGTSRESGGPELDDDAQASMGLLKFNGAEKLFAIDGQHRIKAIKDAIVQKPELATEDLAVIFVAHSIDENGAKRTRKLFSTLNKTAKRVSKGEIIALDEDDAFAVVTRRLVEEFELLRWESLNETRFVAFAKQPELHSSDSKNLTTIISLYDLTRIVYVPMNATGSTRAKHLSLRRPSDRILDEIYAHQTQYWSLLTKYIHQYQELFDSEPTDEIAGKYRKHGGHILFRPIGQKAFAGAVRIMVDRGWSMENAIHALSNVPMQLNEVPWRNILWEPGLERINTKAGSVLPVNLFLHYVGEAPKKRGYNLLEEYRNTINSTTEVLPPVSNNSYLNLRPPRLVD